MRFFSVHNDRGFTQIEISIVVILVGILAAIAAPNLLSWYSTKKVEQALVELRGAFREAQLAAVRGSKDCTLNVPQGDSPTITATPGNCLLSGERFLEGINLRRSPSLATITYNYEGETNRPGTYTLVLSQFSNGSQQRCLVISGPIGLIRVGKYLASDPTGTNANNCTTQP